MPRKKTIKEKLERSLVPFPLFSNIDFSTLEEGAEGELSHNGNTYRYALKSKGGVKERMVYLIHLDKVQMTNAWEDLLMGYAEYKVVTYQERIVTIYPFQEDFFEKVIGMFESEQYYDLFNMRTLYLKNLLARYVLLHLINTHYPNMSILYSCKVGENTVPVLAGTEDKEWIMYAFSKRDANELANKYYGLCKKLTVVYFINGNFEREDRNLNFLSLGARVVSIKQFYREMADRQIMEKQIFFLIEMLYEKRFDWDERSIKRGINVVYTLSDRKVKWMEIPKILVEDALNVLVEDYNNPKDIFHLLCAANLINSYTNRYKSKEKMALKELRRYAKVERNTKKTLDRRVHVMYSFKNQVMESILQLLKMRKKYIRVSLAHVFGEAEHTLLADVKVEGRIFQFKFRGIGSKYIQALHQLGVKDDGVYNTIRLQPIAPALYLYSYHLKWN